MSSFFFHSTASAEIYTLSLHDALPIFGISRKIDSRDERSRLRGIVREFREQHNFNGGVIIRTAASSRSKEEDRKSTRLNSSHSQISYAVFCLKKKTAPSRRLISRGVAG